MQAWFTFSKSCPELSLTVPFDGEEIDQSSTRSEGTANLYFRRCIPIKEERNGDDNTRGYDITPKMDNEVAGDDFKGHESGFKDEKVPASSESKSFIDVAASESNEWRTNGQVRHHLGHAWNTCLAGKFLRVGEAFQRCSLLREGTLQGKSSSNGFALGYLALEGSLT